MQISSGPAVVTITGERTREERDAEGRKRAVDVETERPATKSQSRVGGARLKREKRGVAATPPREPRRSSAHGS